MESHELQPKDLPRFSTAAAVVVTIVVVLGFIGLFLAGYLPHRRQQEKLQADANELREAPPVVDVTMPKPLPSTFDLSLPGDARAMQQTALYARVNGFLKRWLVDMNDHVEKDQLLAEISAPDLDAQLSQARAALEQAKANAASADVNNRLAQATFQRYSNLLTTGSATQQTVDQYQTAANQAQAALNAANASIKSSQASVEQLEAQQGFEKIYAPFAGTITARNYDVGALISPSNTSPGSELFDISQTDRLRIYVKVPQSYVTMMQDKQPAEFSVRNYPGRPFMGYVARSAGVIDPATRTLLTEVDFDNKDGLLWAGMYGQVDFKLKDQKPTLTVPTSALLFEANGTQVALVDGQSKVYFQKVTVGRDMGTSIEITTGLNGNERVVANPGEKLTQGTTVQIARKNGTETATNGPPAVAQTVIPPQAIPAGNGAATAPSQSALPVGLAADELPPNQATPTPGGDK